MLTQCKRPKILNKGKRTHEYSHDEGMEPFEKKDLSTILIGWPMIIKESQRKFIWRLVAAGFGIVLYRIAWQRRIAGISQLKVHHRLEAGSSESSEEDEGSHSMAPFCRSTWYSHGMSMSSTSAGRRRGR